MNQNNHYFFCGVGGSGMLPLALFLRAQGIKVSGSDRGYDQGRSPEKFARIQNAGITLHPQDGSGITDDLSALVVSNAVEDSVPDVAAAKAISLPIQKRAALLADLFHEANTGVVVAGTSGKSTVTAMVGVMLVEAELDPSVVNGAPICNFERQPMRIGGGDLFVIEGDESDEAFGLYNPAIAVVNNVTLDHKPIEETAQMFEDFIARTLQAVILNFDDPLLQKWRVENEARLYSFAIENNEAQIRANDLQYGPTSVGFIVEEGQEKREVHLKVPGAHNVSNALAAMCVGRALGLSLAQCVHGVEKFTGTARRLEVIGTKNEITLIDDFGHNPDKIRASLSTLKTFPGRVLVMFQPHGYGPLKLMGKEIVDVFTELLGPEDKLYMPEVYYAGGTVTRDVTSADIIALAKERGISAHAFETRAEILPVLTREAKAGDRILIMGARDDTLTDFAQEILAFFS